MSRMRILTATALAATLTFSAAVAQRQQEPGHNSQFISLKSISKSLGAIEVGFAQRHDAR